MNFTHLTHRTLGSLVIAGSLALVGCADPVSSSAALATGERGVTAIATDDFYLYWAKGDGSVKRVSLDGGAATTLVTGQQVSSHLAVDKTHLYWTNTNGIVARAPKEGGDAATVAQTGALRGLTLDDTSAYFTVGDGTLQRAPKEGGAMKELASGQSNPGEVAATGTTLFWINETNDTNSGSVMALPTEGGNPLAYVGAEGQVQSVATSRSLVYWTSIAKGTVSVAGLDHGDLHEITVAQSTPQSVVGDEAYVYFSDFEGGVNVASVHGGEATRIGKGPGGGRVSLAIDATSIYWANSVDGAIIMMPKL